MFGAGFVAVPPTTLMVPLTVDTGILDGAAPSKPYCAIGTGVRLQLFPFPLTSNLKGLSGVILPAITTSAVFNP